MKGAQPFAAFKAAIDKLLTEPSKGGQEKPKEP
jgi:hypothetical protein